MLPRLLLISVMATSLAGCFWDDYETSRTITSEVPPDNENETLPDTGFIGNGNLEETTASGWTWYANAGAATFGLSTDQYYSGEQSFRTLIEAAGETWGDIAAGPSAIEVEDGTYYFSGWILGTNGAMANFVASPSDNPETVLASQEIAVTSSWQKVDFEITVPPGVTSLDLPVQMSYGANLGAVIYLDSFALKGGGGGGFIEIPITSNLENWSADQQTNTLSYDEALGVVINPDPSIANQLAMYTFPEPLDPAGIDFTFVINVPEEYIPGLEADDINLQFYVQEVGGSYGGEYWNPESGGGTVEAGTNVFTHQFNGAPATIQRIGLQVLGDVDGLEVGQGISISRIYYPGGDAEAGSDLPLDSGWTSSNDSVEYVGNGVRYSPVAEDDNLLYVLDGPVSLEGATVVYTVDIDQAFKDSGADLQPYAQQNFGSYTGFWSCYVGNADLSVGSAEYRCTIDTDDGVFNIGEEESVRLGFQAKGSPAGTVTITDVQINYPSLPVDSGWRTSTGAEPVYDGGVQYSPTAEDDQLVYDVDADTYSGSTDFEGATFHFSITVNQAYIDSGADLQPFAQVKLGAWPGEWGCYIGNGDLSVDGGTYDCTLQAADFNLPAEGMQIGVQAKGDSIAGWVKITNVRITYPD